MKVKDPVKWKRILAAVFLIPTTVFDLVMGFIVTIGGLELMNYAGDLAGLLTIFIIVYLLAGIGSLLLMIAFFAGKRGGLMKTALVMLALIQALTFICGMIASDIMFSLIPFKYYLPSLLALLAYVMAIVLSSVGKNGDGKGMAIWWIAALLMGGSTVFTIMEPYGFMSELVSDFVRLGDIFTILKSSLIFISFFFGVWWLPGKKPVAAVAGAGYGVPGAAPGMPPRPAGVPYGVPVGAPAAAPRPTGAPAVPPRPTGAPAVPPRPTGAPAVPPRPTGAPAVPPRPTGAPAVPPRPAAPVNPAAPAPSTIPSRSPAAPAYAPTPAPAPVRPSSGGALKSSMPKSAPVNSAPAPAPAPEKPASDIGAGFKGSLGGSAARAGETVILSPEPVAPAGSMAKYDDSERTTDMFAAPAAPVRPAAPAPAPAPAAPVRPAAPAPAPAPAAPVRPAAPAPAPAPAAPVRPAAPAPAAASIAQELKTYKSLLDCGIITQEEFDAKKKQLLGL